MWRMHDGDRVLTDTEWEVFATGLDLLRDQVETDIAAGSDDTAAGIPAFDRLTAEQKLALLAEVARAVRDPAVPVPRHTAASEAALMAALEFFRDMLRSEVEANERGQTDLRECLLAAVAGADDRPAKLPKPAGKRWAAWDDLFECVVGRVFWDFDFAMGDQFLDLPPAEARARLREFGIDPDYYLDAPAEPGERGLIAARQTLARLLGLAVPDDDGLYPTLHDLFHELSVGPVPPDAAAWDDRPWLRVVCATEPSWDCDLPTWRAEFAGAVPADPFRVAPAGAAGGGSLPEGVRVERGGEGWVVRMPDGPYWCDLVENGWTDSPDEYSPALAFPTGADAEAAYLQADRMYEDRAARQRAALDPLDELDALDADSPAS